MKKEPLVWIAADKAVSDVDLQCFRQLGVKIAPDPRHVLSLDHISADAPRLVRGVQCVGADLLDPADKPRDVGRAKLDCLLRVMYKIPHCVRDDVVIKLVLSGETTLPEKTVRFLQNYPGKIVLDLQSISPETDLISRLQAFSNVEVLIFALPQPVAAYKDMVVAARAILQSGVKSVLVKGTAVRDSLYSQDYWTNGKESFWLANTRYTHSRPPGAGDILSSAISACLALGNDIKDALVIAVMYSRRSIRLAKANGLFHDGWPEDQADLPYITATPLQRIPKQFIPCRTRLYPVVNSSIWLEKLLPPGIKSLQLRIKDKPANLETQIKTAVALAKKYAARLFINDYWELAIRFGATGVHLGQEDLQTADLEKIHKAGLLLGISTHCYYEVARAHSVHPSYMACGPIYPTSSKIMSFPPQGLEQLKCWRRTLNYPLVAIGGINSSNLPGVLQSGVDGVALISAISKATDPAAATRELLKLYERERKS